ncbi:hypothetical protein B0H13DRAFT_1972870 [Mycena leptocephala]|nr:hypothetical protein B0H13DRAFT_1972870 [Mycena leptocephala]
MRLRLSNFRLEQAYKRTKQAFKQLHKERKRLDQELKQREQRCKQLEQDLQQPGRISKQLKQVLKQLERKRRREKRDLPEHPELEWERKQREREERERRERERKEQEQLLLRRIGLTQPLDGLVLKLKFYFNSFHHAGHSCARDGGLVFVPGIAHSCLSPTHHLVCVHCKHQSAWLHTGDSALRCEVGWKYAVLRRCACHAPLAPQLPRPRHEPCGTNKDRQGC